ncbi:glycosyltransferase [Sphingomonas soli]|uniref:glycosyltransferase n=1 Tax=Sphingomonas soli TaxID=266127 RepID=UPI0008337E58|nr:glycosyltransferase [Sphingomonas soli]
MIPKIMHFIWVGDESKCPTNCMDTWRALNPDWEFLVWGNQDLAEQDWFNRAHMDAMYSRELNGVADMMRWEILHAKGGVVVDADSIALRPLDDHLLDCEAFACWENEIARPGLIAAGYFGCEAGNPFVEQIIRDIHDEPSVTHEKAWKTVGPQRLTDAYRKYNYSRLRIYPSHYFIPQHFTGRGYDGPDPVYADQLWGSTLRSYDQIHKREIAVPAAPVSRLEAKHAPYFVQRVNVSNAFAGLGRGAVLREFCAGKRALHVGCADWPITDLSRSLHLFLESICASLDGVDPHTEALDMLRPHVKGGLFSSLAEATGSYDVVLVPEVMEHVANVEEFLGELQAIDAAEFLISVPDAFQCRGRHFDYVESTETFVEVVHPDHNVWYTPYTFANTVQKYSDLALEQMWFFNHISLLARFSKKQIALAA